jgi:uncharacterized membrane protein
VIRGVTRARSSDSKDACSSFVRRQFSRTKASDSNDSKGVVDMSNGHNVIAVTFDEGSKAYQALSTLRRADGDGRVGIRSAVIVERQPEGTIRLQEGEDNAIGAGTAGGSLIGMLVGVLGGPVGVLLGLGAGMAIGAAVDLDRADDVDDVLSQMSKSIPVGTTAIIAEVDESAVEVVDGEMAALGGTVIRRPAEQVLAELETAEQAARASEKEARRVMREAKMAERAEKREQSKEEWDERLSALKDKLTRHGKTTA